MAGLKQRGRTNRMGKRPDDPSESNASGGAPFEAYLVKDPEALARNIARMIEEAGKAASTWLAPRESQAKADTSATRSTTLCAP